MWTLGEPDPDPATLQAVADAALAAGDDRRAMLYLWRRLLAGAEAGALRQLAAAHGRQDNPLAAYIAAALAAPPDPALMTETAAALRGAEAAPLAKLTALLEQARGRTGAVPALADAVPPLKHRDYATARRLLQHRLAHGSEDAIAIALLAGLEHQDGNNDTAKAWLVFGLLAAPREVSLLRLLTEVFAATGPTGRAVDYARLLTLADPGHVQGWAHLARLLGIRGEDPLVHEWVARRGLALAPDHRGLTTALAIALDLQGRSEDSLACFRQVVQADPAALDGWPNYLFALHFAADADPDAIARAHFDYGARLAAGMARQGSSAAPAARRDGPLRLGFVSGDFYQHAAAYFIEPLFDALSRDRRFVLHAYSGGRSQDAVTQRLRRHCAAWTQTLGMDDAGLIDRIRADGIDILIDLSGHTAGSRTAIFAARPAPLQVSWLGYPNTTGLRQIDWRLSDAVIDPPGSERLYAEKLWRLPGAYCCYRPLVQQPDLAGHPDYAVRPTPALASGHVTFGSCNKLAKIGPATLAAWAALLRAVPESRLLVEAAGFQHEEFRAVVTRRFAAAGLDAARLQLVDRERKQQYLRYNSIDIALDPFPVNGHTTSCDALWMGVPVVTLAGRSFIGRLSTSMLTALGREAWIARDVDDYVAIASTLAADPVRLDAERQALRPRMAASPVMDAAGFAAAFADALLQMQARAGA